MSDYDDDCLEQNDAIRVSFARKNCMFRQKVYRSA